MGKRKCESKKGENEMTNLERVKAMNEEELAMVIMCPLEHDKTWTQEDCTIPKCVECAQRWLNKEASK